MRIGGFHSRATRRGQLVNGLGVRQRRMLPRGNLRELCERAPLEINHQQQDAEPGQRETAGHQQRQLLRSPRRVGIARMLSGDRLLQRLQPRRQHEGVALGRVHGGLLVLFEGQLRGVELRLELQKIIGQLVAAERGRRIGVRRQQPCRQKNRGARRKKFWIKFQIHSRTPAA
jgi:hypothetical protein